MKEYIIKVGDEPDIMGNYPLTEKAKELVRCKECKHWYHLIDDRGHCECFALFHDGDLFTDDDWYCANGERKDGEQDG